ncbi:MAG: hypothetical protein M1833_004036 [Piccolia ochrophora]|nr:MAG: hypothetical protein M1833_004036 [Piccolia ochrophora]
MTRLSPTTQAATHQEPASSAAPASSARSSEDGSPTQEQKLSDIETDRPVREKLKKTSIGRLPGQKHSPVGRGLRNDETSHTQPAPTEVEPAVESIEEDRDTVSSPRKRSFEDTREVGDQEEGSPRGRKEHRRRTNSRGSGSDSRSSSLGSDSSNEGSQMQEVTGSSKSSNDPSQVPGYRAQTPTRGGISDAAMGDIRHRVLSPKKKRSRDQFDKDLEKDIQEPLVEAEAEPRGSEDSEGDKKVGNRASRIIRDEPEKKRHRDISQEAPRLKEKENKIPPTTSGFANTSAVSPFGTLGASSASADKPKASVFGSKSTSPPQTSLSAFASSGFGKLSGSNESPFGALGQSSTPSGSAGFASAGSKDSAPSGFAAISSPKSPVSESGFGGGSFGGSAFGAATSGFGKLGSGFGGGFGGATGSLTSFASKEGSGIIGLKEKPAKAFGAPEAVDEEDAEADDDAEKGSDGDIEEKRLQIQEVETGEEEEETIFSNRAKLFYFNRTDKAWKERGMGVLKLNISLTHHNEELKAVGEHEQEDSDEDPEKGEAGPQKRGKRSARLLMRAEGVYRVLLNVPVFKDIQVGDKDGLEPPGKTIIMTAPEEGSPVMFQIRFGSNATATKLWEHIEDLKGDL